MTTSPGIHYREWGDGTPILALHGLGLESSAFTGLADGVVGHGFKMMAADLPGFGLTPADGRPLTPPVLAEPVIELARSLDKKPIVMGMSLGGRVALEAALLAPELFRGVVMVAPPLPPQSRALMRQGARLLSPGIAQRIPIDLAWPLLKRLAQKMEDNLTGDAEHDWLLRASRRTIYYISCPATRWAFVSATRGLALDPGTGPDGLWTRLPDLDVPAAFVWGGEDKFVPAHNADIVAEVLPTAFQMVVPCGGHYDNGSHFWCMEAGAVEAIQLVDAVARKRRRPASDRTRNRLVACRVPHEADAESVGLETAEHAHELAG